MGDLYFFLPLLGFLSWILVIPFDVIKTVVQAETDPYKHGNIAQIFKAKTDVSCNFLKTNNIQLCLLLAFLEVIVLNSQFELRTDY